MKPAPDLEFKDLILRQTDVKVHKGKIKCHVSYHVSSLKIKLFNSGIFQCLTYKYQKKINKDQFKS